MIDEAINPLFLILLLISIISIAIFIHELGHLIFGLMSGYHFLLFRIWKLAIVRPSTGYRFRIVKKPDSFGQCIMYPPRIDKNPKIMISGGFIFNLLAGVLFLASSIFINDYIFLNIVKITGSINIIYAIIEYASKYETDDGQKLINMKLSNDIVLYNCIQLIAKDLVNGYSYKDINSELLQVEDICPDSSIYEKELYLCGYYRMLEFGCFQIAKNRIDKLALSNAIGKLAYEIRRERIFFYNLNNFNKDVIRNPVINPSDIRINILDDKIFMKFKKYIYQGEVKSSKIILKTVGNIIYTQNSHTFY